MTASNSTRITLIRNQKSTGVTDTSAKPERPEGCPLFPHATKRWAKKIRGKMFYFGSWDDLPGALAKYNEQKDDLHAGRKVRKDEEDGPTVKDLTNKFLNAKRLRVDSGEMTQRTWNEYLDTCEVIAKSFGSQRAVSDLRPDDFQALRGTLAKRLASPVSLGNAVQRVRTVFKYGVDSGIIPPILFGPEFKKPDKKSMRKHKAKGGKLLFTAEEILRLFDAASVPMRAMILLGINCGFGNTDCGTLPLSAVNLDSGWIDYPRPKTGIDRRCRLWPETVQAIRDYLAVRPTPKDEAHAGLVFVTKYGGAWAKEIIDSPVAKEMSKLLKELHINGRRRLGFYALRHTFEIIGGDSRDQVAVNHIMGHADDSMAATYREHINDERLVAVVEHVRKWLFVAKGGAIADRP